MDELRIGKHVAETQREISALLNDLERVTGRAVLTAELIRIQVTTIDDRNHKYVREFRIDLAPQPDTIGRG